MGDLETRTGAINRAEAAAAAAAAASMNADFSVGLEGGCGDDIDGNLTCFAWMAILPTSEGARVSTARTATLLLPQAVAQLVRSGTELGEADDIVFGRKGSKHKDGAVGILTRGLVDRAAYYEHALLMALAPIISPDKYT
jgi:inosine/xanthosine triphosphatase